MLFKALAAPVALALFLLSGQAGACTVSEIVSMVKDGSGNSAIEKACKRRADGAPRCKFLEVVELARADKDEEDIRDRCGLCRSPQCNTNWGPCLITGGVGRLQDNGPCSCPTPQGWIPGRVSCNN